MLTSSTDRHPFSDCLTHRVCREAGTNRSKSKIALRLFSNGIRGWDRSIKVFVEKVSSLLNVKDKWWRLRDLNQRRGHSSRWRGSRSQRGQSSWFIWGGGVSVQQMLAGGYSWAVGAAGVRGSVWLSAALAHICLWHVALADLGAWQVNPGVTLVTLDHGSTCERLPAETRHQVPRIVIWQERACSAWSLCQTCNNVMYVEIRITLPESTIMSSSSPDPSSSLNTTCLPWRNTVLFPAKPSTFCTFTTPSSMSWPSQCRCSSLGSSLQVAGLGRCWGWRGMLMSSSGSSLIVWPPKETGCCSPGTVERPCWTSLSSPAECSLSFLLFFFFSLSAFLRSSGCRVAIVCCIGGEVCVRRDEVKHETGFYVTSTQLTSFLVWLDSGAPGCGRFLLLSWGTLGGRWAQEVGGPGVQPSLSAVLPVLFGGLELLRSGESCKNKWRAC